MSSKQKNHKESIKKTNAARMLDLHKIAYNIIEYAVAPDDLSAIHVANVTGINIKQIFKTLVCIDEHNNPLVACIPGDDELDLKSLARLAGVKKCSLIAQKDLLKITGYQRGGCSPFGMKKAYPSFYDISALLHVKIYVSAGIRGKQLEIDHKVLSEILGAKNGKIIC